MKVLTRKCCTVRKLIYLWKRWKYILEEQVMEEVLYIKRKSVQKNYSGKLILKSSFSKNWTRNYPLREDSDYCLRCLLMIPTRKVQLFWDIQTVTIPLQEVSQGNYLLQIHSNMNYKGFHFFIGSMSSCMENSEVCRYLRKYALRYNKLSTWFIITVKIFFYDMFYTGG